MKDTLKSPAFYLAIVCMMLLTACSSIGELKNDLSDKFFGREPPNPPAKLEDFRQTYNAKVLWSAQLGKSERYDYTPVLDAGFVYGANAEGELSKFDATTGKQVWRVKAGEPISGGVGVGSGIVLVGTNKGNVMAFDLNGKQLWKAKVSSEVLSAPRYFDGNVIVRAGDSHIFGLDAADGTRKWVYERASPALSLRSSAGLVADGGAVYAGFSSGKMVAIRADNGKLIWEATVAQPKGVTEIERISDITSLPVVDGPVVFAVAYQGRVAAVDRRSGKVIWNRDISSYSGLSLQDDRVYISHALGSVFALDESTSKTFWRQPGLLNRRLSLPVPVSDLIAVGDLEGYVHFLSREDGSFASRIKVDSNPVMSMIQGGTSSQVIVATRGGGLYALAVEDNGTGASAKGSGKGAGSPGSGEERSILFKGEDPDKKGFPGITEPD